MVVGFSISEVETVSYMKESLVCTVINIGVESPQVAMATLTGTANHSSSKPRCEKDTRATVSRAPYLTRKPLPIQLEIPDPR